jgi:hypothetical protein
MTRNAHAAVDLGVFQELVYLRKITATILYII